MRLVGAAVGASFALAACGAVTELPVTDYDSGAGGDAVSAAADAGESDGSDDIISFTQPDGRLPSRADAMPDDTWVPIPTYGAPPR